MSDFALSIYPNPATTDLVIEASETIESVSISDVTGRVVAAQIHPAGLKLSTDISSLAQATYFIAVKTVSGKIVIKRVVKQ